MTAPPARQTPLRRLETWLGHRGMFLMLLGCVQIIYGAGLLAAGNPVHEHWWPGSLTSLGGFPLSMWGTIWCAIGALCILTSFGRGGSDRIGFAVGELLNFGWAVFAIQRWISTGEKGAWAPAAIYVGIAVGVFIVSGWPDTPKTPLPDLSQLPPPPTKKDLARLEQDLIKLEQDVNGTPPAQAP